MFSVHWTTEKVPIQFRAKFWNEKTRWVFTKCREIYLPTCCSGANINTCKRTKLSVFEIRLSHTAHCTEAKWHCANYVYVSANTLRTYLITFVARNNRFVTIKRHGRLAWLPDLPRSISWQLDISHPPKSRGLVDNLTSLDDVIHHLYMLI